MTGCSSRLNPTAIMSDIKAAQRHIDKRKITVDTRDVYQRQDVGSNELSMKVYEITPKKGAREIDYVNSTVELGSDTYNSGRITEDSIMKVCEILNKFRRKMREYDVREYKAYASSAVREAEAVYKRQSFTPSATPSATSFTASAAPPTTPLSDESVLFPSELLPF